MNKKCINYSLIALLVIVCDRLSKWCIETHLDSTYELNSFLSLTKTTNRGISWGMFNETSTTGFWFITALIITICGVLIVHAYRRFATGQTIYGETLILAGGFSNLIDRILFGGVLDFILFSYGSWSFPVFNIADAAIVLGASIMILQTFE